MFAIIETEVVPMPAFIERVKERLRKGSGVTVLPDSSFGVRILRATVVFWCGMPEKRRARRMEQALAAIAASGISAVVAPRDFEYLWLFERYRLKAATGRPLLKKMAARLAVYTMDTFRIPGDVTAAVIAERFTADFAACAETLCRRVRHLGIFCGRETKAFCAELRERYGLAVMEGIPFAMGEKPGLLISFDPVDPGKLRRLHRDTLVIALGGMKEEEGLFPHPGILPHAIADGASFRPPARLEGLVRRDSDVNTLLYALYSTGAVRQDEIIISGLTFDGRSACPPEETQQAATDL